MILVAGPLETICSVRMDGPFEKMHSSTAMVKLFRWFGTTTCLLYTSHLEEQILEKQKDLIEAKTKSLQSTERIEELYKEAMSAFRRYLSLIHI